MAVTSQAEQAIRAARAVAQPAKSPSRLWQRLVLIALDLLAVNLAFYLAWFARYRLGLIRDLDPGNYVEHVVYLPMQVALAIVFVGIVGVRGQYRLPRAQSAFDDLSTIFTASGLALMTIFAASTFVRYPAESRLALIFAWALMTFLVLVGRAFYVWLLGWFHHRSLGVARTLVVGDNTIGRMIMEALATRPHLGYSVVGFLGDSRGDYGRFRYLGGQDEIERAIRDHGISQVVIALPSTSHEAILRIVDHCRRDGVQFRLVPDLYELSLGRLDLDTVSGIPLMGVKEPSIVGFNFLLKRAIDIGLSGLLLALFWWVFLLIGVLVWLEQPHCSPFFGQQRVGKGGRHFCCWKFRSMQPDADAQLASLLERNEAEGPIFKMRQDPRRTRVGGWIRRWSLDELPQLWNVLKGEMSLVGPRPATPREVALYEDWQLQRLETPPGITGLWQVSGRSELGFAEQVVLDIMYIENWSLGLDLRILLRTVPAVLSGKGAF